MDDCWPGLRERVDTGLRVSIPDGLCATETSSLGRGTCGDALGLGWASDIEDVEVDGIVVGSMMVMGTLRLFGGGIIDVDSTNGVLDS